MQTDKVEIGKIKVGRYIVIEGEAYQITSIQKSTPGKHGHAKYRVDAANLITGNKKNIILSGHANVDVPVIEKKVAQVLSISDDVASVMDMENYETFDLNISEDLKDKVKTNSEVVYWDILGKRIMKEVKK